jgi:predicted transcriptional regulator
MKKIKLDELQIAIMHVLWGAGEASVLEVRERLLEKKSLAVTTIGTVISRLEKKGIVAHRVEGRQYLYRPLITESEVKRSMVSSLADLLFKGQNRLLLNHLIRESEFEPQALEQLK